MGLRQIWLGKKKTNLVVKKELLFGDENSISNFWNWNSWGLPPFYLIELRWQQKCIEFFELCCCCSPLIRGACLRFEFFPQKIIIVVVVHLFPFFFNSSLLLHFWCIFQKIQSKNTICKWQVLAIMSEKTDWSDEEGQNLEDRNLTTTRSVKCDTLETVYFICLILFGFD